MWRKGVDLFAPLSDLDLDLQSLRSNRGSMYDGFLPHTREAVCVRVCVWCVCVCVYVCVSVSVCVCLPRGGKGGGCDSWGGVQSRMRL